MKRCGLFRQIQCARDDGTGEFQNEFIELFDAIVAYLTVSTFVSFDFAAARNKITVKDGVPHALCQLVNSDGTLEKLDLWWFRVSSVIDELQDLQMLSGIDGLVPPRFELNRLLYLCIVDECFMQAIVPAITELKIVFIEKTPMLQGDAQRDALLENGQNRWNNLEQAGLRVSKRSGCDGLC